GRTGAALRPREALPPRQARRRGRHPRQRPRDPRRPAVERDLAPRGRRFLQEDSEQPLLVEAPRIGVQGLRLADQGGVARTGLGGAPEAPAGVDVIDDDRPARAQGGPGPIHLEADVAFAVQAVVDEEVDLAEPREDAREAPPTRSADVGPASGASAIDRDADLVAPDVLERRMVDAPQMPGPVAL